MFKRLLFFTLILLVACREQPELVAPQVVVIDDEQPATAVRNDLQLQLTGLVAGVEIDFASSPPNPLVIIVYDIAAPNQIELLAEAAQAFASIIFADASTDYFSLFSIHGENDFRYRHFIVIYREVYGELMVAADHFEVYELAERYFIGLYVTGEIEFYLHGMRVMMPLQRPVN